MNRRFIDNLYVSALILYAIAGMMLAPYHGDESTIIHKSRDWYLILGGNLTALFYSPTHPEMVEQELRLVNGTTSAYGMGIGETLIGLPPSAVPQQWAWGADWTYNRDSGHMASRPVLFVARLSSTLMLAVSIALVFFTARRIGGRGVAWLATGLYATLPALLLNGRRAMFEGATMLGIALVLAAGVSLLTASHDQRQAIQRWVLLGAAVGFGLASKHILLITALPVFAMLLLFGRPTLGRTISNALIAGLVAVLVFLALNPAWWTAPLQVPREVLRLRSDMAKGQVEFYGGYNSLSDRVVALFAKPFQNSQYFEDQRGWPHWLNDEIVAYESSGLAGIAWGGIGLVALQALALIGWLVSGPRSQPVLLMLAVFVFDLLAIFALTPLPWQRYYLPLAAPWAIVLGVGLSGLLAWGNRYVR